MVMLKDFVWLWVRVQHQTRSRCNRMDQRCYNNAKRSLAKERHSNQAIAIATGKSPGNSSSERAALGFWICACIYNGCGNPVT